MINPSLISVIVSTYNRPDALALVLESLILQSDKNFEIVIADDGSTDETKQLINSFKEKTNIPITHAWQPDKGFRLAASRNNAVRQAKGEYLIFLDGDCIPTESFVQNHRKLAEKGFFVTGNRILISQKLTDELLHKKVNNIAAWSLGTLLKEKFNGGLNRLAPIVDMTTILPFRKGKPRAWKKLRGCNFALWKTDYEAVNGSDESFEGWGFEDSDLAVRLINLGIHRKSGNFSTGVFHLYHPEGKKEQTGPNWETLQLRLREGISYCPHGIKEN